MDQRRGWTLLTAVFLLFMLAGIFTAHDDHTQLLKRNAREHPITALMADAKVAFTNRLSKQSKTLHEAVAEYKRRYGRNPPHGFDHWWEYAKKNNFKLIDEFDVINEDLAPFWALTGEELRRRVYQVGSTTFAQAGSNVSTDGAVAFRRPRAHSGRPSVCRQNQQSVRRQ